MDLGTFYREFQNPPQLTSLSLHISTQSMADDLVLCIPDYFLILFGESQIGLGLGLANTNPNPN